ncbi:MAG: hypothetical protein IIZ25_09560 [Thermoguttaceae bacterium]|nr:hypothetical protein [Thermoguttaceae bacterium]
MDSDVDAENPIINDIPLGGKRVAGANGRDRWTLPLFQRFNMKRTRPRTIGLP